MTSTPLTKTTQSKQKQQSRTPLLLTHSTNPIHHVPMADLRERLFMAHRLNSQEYVKATVLVSHAAACNYPNSRNLINTRLKKLNLIKFTQKKRKKKDPFSKLKSNIFNQLVLTQDTKDYIYIQDRMYAIRLLDDESSSHHKKQVILFAFKKQNKIIFGLIVALILIMCTNSSFLSILFFWTVFHTSASP